MRIVLQRVSRASVKIGGETVGAIGAGLLALVCIGQDDSAQEIDALAEKTVQLRIFADDAGKMNRSLIDAGGEILAVSQFTLYADCRKGRRPSFIGAAKPERAVPLLERWTARIESHGVRVAQGRFGAMMDVELVNDGPVTIILDSRELNAG
ncbi:D-tyrosyl-tRNA(Tyr) deacylase [Candidatus Sumerlaeota bacterium]|nr:D-tyrosyl-tRNA(Tyr) deacylase [Candidatus Sumerlaeota bacterium]